MPLDCTSLINDIIMSPNVPSVLLYTCAETDEVVTGLKFGPAQWGVSFISEICGTLFPIYYVIRVDSLYLYQYKCRGSNFYEMSRKRACNVKTLCLICHYSNYSIYKQFTRQQTE